MPIYGVGIDLVRVARLETLINRWGERFETRVFTEFEIQFCSGRKNRTPCLALRFAAKRSLRESPRPGDEKAGSVARYRSQARSARKTRNSLTPRALEYCEEKGIRSWHLSLTDEGNTGSAVVVLETR